MQMQLPRWLQLLSAFRFSFTIVCDSVSSGLRICAFVVLCCCAPTNRRAATPRQPNTQWTITIHITQLVASCNPMSVSISGCALHLNSNRVLVSRESTTYICTSIFPSVMRAQGATCSHRGPRSLHDLRHAASESACLSEPGHHTDGPQS